MSCFLTKNPSEEAKQWFFSYLTIYPENPENPGTVYPENPARVFRDANPAGWTRQSSLAFNQQLYSRFCRYS